MKSLLADDGRLYVKLDVWYADIPPGVAVPIHAEDFDNGEIDYVRANYANKLVHVPKAFLADFAVEKRRGEHLESWVGDWLPGENPVDRSDDS